MANGYIYLQRKIQDCWIWQNEVFSRGQAWIDLLLLAEWKDRKKRIGNEIITIKRGSFHLSILILADRWKWSRNRVRRFLEILEADNMITTDRTPYGTTVTIVKYEDYQIKRTPDEPPYEPTDEPPNEPTDEPQMNKDNKRNKRINNKAVYFPDHEELNQRFLEYIQMRKDIKKPMSDRAITLALNKLASLSGGDEEKAIRILNQSIFYSWQGLFELKDESVTQKTPQYKKFSHSEELSELEKELLAN